MRRGILWLVILASFSAIADAQTCTPQAAQAPATTQVFTPAAGFWTSNIELSYPNYPINSSIGCTWKLTADVSWITFNGLSSGTIVTSYLLVGATVAPNTGNAPLHGTITLTEGNVTEGDFIIQRFPITVLSNSCAYSVDPPSAQVGQQGGSGQFILTATPPDCLPFDPNSTYYGANLTTSASVRYDHGIFYWALPPNAGTALSATATISASPGTSAPGPTFTVTQDGSDGSMQVGCPLTDVQRVGAQFPTPCTVIGGTQPYKWSITGGALPAGVSQGAFPGSSNEISGNPLDEGPYSFTETVTDSSNPPQTASVTVSGVIQPVAVSLTCSSGGPAQPGVFYFAACEPKGGTAPYQWSVSDGALPNGLSLSQGPAGGVIISGTPTDASNYYYVLQVADTSGPVPQIASIPFSGKVWATPPPLSITCNSPSSTLYTGQSLNSQTQFSCTPQGGLGTLQISISAGTLPPGIVTSGPTTYPFSFSGTPITVGDFTFTVQVTDSYSPPQTAQQNVEMIVNPGLTFVCLPAIGPTVVGTAYTSTCTASGGVPPYTFSSPYILPVGLSFAHTDTTATVSGTPTTANLYSYTLYATDSAQHSAQVFFSGSTSSPSAPPRLILTCIPNSVTGAEVGVPITPVQCTATGGTTPYVWSTPVGLSGLSFSAAGNTATLSGTPATTGSVGTIFVNDSSSPQPQSASGFSGIYIAARLSMSCSPAASPNSVGQVVSISCTASGGVGASTWSSTGNLPPGLTYSTGAIRGSPMTPGSYNFTITLTDNASTPVAISQTYAGTILPVGAAVLLECSASSGKYTGGLAIAPINCKVSGGTPPYQWSIANGSLPFGLSLQTVSSGMAVQGTPTVAGNYSFAVSVADSVGQTGTWPIPVSVSNPQPLSSPSLDSVLPHLTFGGGWQQRIAFLSSYPGANFEFFDDAGNPVGFPYREAATGITSTASFYLQNSQTLQANQVVILDSTADDSSPLTTGSALVSNATGFGMFSFPAFNWQTLVPIDSTRDTAYVVAFDNTGTIETGVAIANSDTNPAMISVAINDDTGAVLATTTLSLGPGAHTSFMLDQQYTVTTGKRGTVRFSTSSYGIIHVLAIRSNGPALTTLPVLPASATPGNSIAHVTYNNGFTSTFYLANMGTSATQVTLQFFNENGTPLAVPLLLPKTGMTATSASFTQPLAAGGLLVVATQSNNALAGVVGSAKLVTSGNVNGFEIFDWTTYGQEASVPLGGGPYNYSGTLIFDNTNGFTTGVAIANPTAGPMSVTVTINDETGKQLQTGTITLPANGHTSFMLPSNYPVTNGLRGTASFADSLGGVPIIIGIRAGPNGSLTTIPPLN